MEINADKEEGCSIGMYVADESAVVYVPADVCYGCECGCNVRGVMHSQEKAC